MEKIRYHQFCLTISSSLSFKPSPDAPLSFDLGLQGYTGQREGVTGSFRLKWEY